MAGTEKIEAAKELNLKKPLKCALLDKNQKSSQAMRRKLLKEQVELVTIGRIMDLFNSHLRRTKIYNKTTQAKMKNRNKPEKDYLILNGMVPSKR